MSQPHGTNIHTADTSDDTDTRRAEQSRRKAERRRDRHTTKAQLHRTAQYPIRKLLVSA